MQGSGDFSGKRRRNKRERERERDEKESITRGDVCEEEEEEMLVTFGGRHSYAAVRHVNSGPNPAPGQTGVTEFRWVADFFGPLSWLITRPP